MDKLGKYEIRRELGRGAMGVVYEAWDPMIKRTVAVKTIRADALARDEAADLVARFRREAQAAGRLTHPNIVSIYDFDEVDGTSFIAMEYVAGRELREMFAASERFALADAVRIMDQILAALDYSHRNGVVHRDIKPANVFVQADGTAKVADFGIAHIDTSSLTQAGTVMGTPGYMSPEQILGLAVDGRSDLFSAGVILYQFVTGERPFAASAPTTVMQKVLKEEPLPPSTLNVQLPDAVDDVLKRALAKKPEDRYQTAAQFAAALRAAVGPRAAPTPLPGVAAGATEATIVAPPAATTAVETPRTATPPAYASTSGSRFPTGAIAVVGGLTVMAIAVVGALVMKRDAPPKETTAASAAASPSSQTASSHAAAPAVPSVPAVAAPVPGPEATPPPAPPAAAAKPPPALEPGTLVITAVGLGDPSHPRYQGNTAQLADDVRADARGQLVEKALGLLVERESFARHYGVLSERLVAKSASFVGPVVRESEPRMGKDGLMSVTTEAVVNVKAVQKSLNRMSREERIQLIRANGDPRVALRVRVRDADQPNAPARAAPAAENLLKERIKSFGFRTWSDDAASGGARGADFVVTADATVKRLTTRLEASGITITKYAIASMTVKGVDAVSGEEIYYNTALPKGGSSYATEDEALAALGRRIADEFTRDLFLQHVSVSGRRVVLTIAGLPDRAADAIARELVALPDVIAARPRGAGAPRSFELELGGSGSAADLVARDVLSPLNTKLGQTCLALGATSGDEVGASFDARCADDAILNRLDTLPPAGLYRAPPARRSAVVANPETLRKLAI